MAAKESIYIDKHVINQFLHFYFLKKIIQKNAEKKILDLGSVPNDLIQNKPTKGFYTCG